MKDDIKKRFIDILFESEEDEEVIEEELKDVNPFFEGQKTIKAKDILYSKSNKNTTFIDIANSYDEKEEPKYTFEPKKAYKISKSISPMFGYDDDLLNKIGIAVENNNQKIESKEEPQAVLTKRHNSYLGTVLSPYFGTDVKNDFSNTMSLSIHKINKEDNDLMKEIIEANKEKSKDDLLQDQENILKEDFIPSQVTEEVLEDNDDNISIEDFVEENMEPEFAIEDESQIIPDDFKEEEKQEEFEHLSDTLSNFKLDFADEIVADDNKEIGSFLDADEDFSKFKEHTGETEEIDLLEDLFSEDN